MIDAEDRNDVRAIAILTRAPARETEDHLDHLLGIEGPVLGAPPNVTSPPMDSPHAVHAGVTLCSEPSILLSHSALADRLMSHMNVTREHLLAVTWT
jgi:hypothetical protein